MLNPRTGLPIPKTTLNRHFRRELDVGAVALKQLIASKYFAALDAGAGVSRDGQQPVSGIDEKLALNVTALVRLTYAALSGSLKGRGGAIINIASVLGIVPELLSGVYGGTKAS